MRYKLLILFIFLTSNVLFGQSFKEVLSFHENGKPRTVSYKNENLELVKTNEYDDTGKLLSEFNYDPVTKLRNGDFFDTNNNGSFNQGKLNCKDCTLIFGNESSSGFKWFGDFVNGKPNGEISIFKIFKIRRLQYDPYTSYLLSYDSKSRISYSSYVDTGETSEEFVTKLNYNENGELDGVVKPSITTKVFFNNGLIQGIIRYEESNINFVRDSIFFDSKIWKQNGSYVKNKGLPIFKYNEFEQPRTVDYKVIDNSDEFFKSRVIILDQNHKNVLDNYGVYSIREKVNTEPSYTNKPDRIEFFFEDIKPIIDDIFINLSKNNYIDYSLHMESEIGYSESSKSMKLESIKSKKLNPSRYGGIRNLLDREREIKSREERESVLFYKKTLKRLSPYYFYIRSNYLSTYWVWSVEDIYEKYKSFVQINPFEGKDYFFINFEGIVSIIKDNFPKHPTYIVSKDTIVKLDLNLLEKELERINQFKDLETLHNSTLEKINSISPRNIENLQKGITDLRNNLQKRGFVLKTRNLILNFYEKSRYKNFSRYLNTVVLKNAKYVFVDNIITDKGLTKNIRLSTDIIKDFSTPKGILDLLDEYEKDKNWIGDKFNSEQRIEILKTFYVIEKGIQKLLPPYWIGNRTLNELGEIEGDEEQEMKNPLFDFSK